jgi:2-oxoglutarate dehydrogenase E1 component
MADQGPHASILENMREGVISLDLGGCITTFNFAAEQILGFKAEDVVGSPFAPVFLALEDSDDLVQAVLDAIYDGETVHQKRVRLKTPDGQKILSTTTTFLKKDSPKEGDRPGGVLLVFSDITETEKLRETVRTLEALRGERLVRAFRERGHVLAELDPLGFARRAEHPELTPVYHGISDEELERPFSLLLGSSPIVNPLREILTELRRIYCGPVGVQYMHIDDLEVQRWVQERLEDRSWEEPLSRSRQMRILRKLMDAEVFEEFVDRNFRGSKRFSLEGGETLIPLLDQAFETSAGMGIEEIVVGMSHRGRLNAIVNLFGTPARELMRRFEKMEDPEEVDPVGDVRFHLGLESTHQSSCGRDVRLSLCFNPSHLEFVGPVVLGRTRARQETRLEGKSTVLPLIVHGDAAFAGQGIVQEQLNLSRLAGYETGGTVHVILNNQIGFTTEPKQGRSTQYATDVARMLQIPVFHVNGEHPEAVNRVIRLALEFRQRWQRDVVVDMYCFRRHGHMEQDNPELTQPRLYEEIRRRPPIHQTYTENLIRLGQIRIEEAQAIRTSACQALEFELEAAQGPKAIPTTSKQITVDPPTSPIRPVTTVELADFLTQVSTLPSGFTPHAKVRALLRRRQSLAKKGGQVDWSTAETLAFASLLSSGISIRLSGQDSERGTFGHRHAVLHDTQTGATHVPLASLPSSKAPFSIYNSPLSEAGVLGFEFGYSIEQARGLVIWEAQFGDFANAAQVIIDQFIVSSEAKWHQTSNLCLLLPHGLEGQGPEHSSARMERFLQLCADENIEVIVPTKASQIFHFLRRQATLATPHPAVVFTPKSFLYHPSVPSPLEEFSSGQFEPVLRDKDRSQAKKALLCTGAIGTHLIKERDAQNADAAIIRLEQLYPFPAKVLDAILNGLQEVRELVWVQEEPRNMGAWHWIQEQITRLRPDLPLRCVAREESASPASGSLAFHQRGQDILLDRALRESLDSNAYGE